MRNFIVSLLFVLQAAVALAQTPTGVYGTVVDSKTQKPLENVLTSIQNTTFSQLTDVTGTFRFDNLEEGRRLLLIRSTGYRDQLLPVEIVSGKMIDVGTVLLEEDITAEQQLSLITITETDLGDDNSGSESTAGLLQASRDAFQQAAAFNWGQARFRIRGLDNEYATTMINGVPMNKLYDGRPQWSNWGGLNDATRIQEFTMGSTPSDYTFGGILGTQQIHTRASVYRPGTRISFSGTNTNYNWRVMGTHISGMNADGWAYVISAGRRWAVEGYFDGTDYSANSFFASVEKKLTERSSLNFTAIYAENSRGKNSPNTDEVTRIAGEKYNSYWGWQDGEKRNSRDKDVQEPIFMLSHFWKISDKTELNSNVAYQTGKIGNSRLDFQNADNPDPTYYRNLPSFFTSTYDNQGVFVGNTQPYLDLAANATFLTNRQIDWEAMYQTNANTANGRSAYILYEDRTDDDTFTANTILSSQLSENIVLNAGATYRNLKSHNFANVLDLLGGQFFEDFDNFQSGSRAEADLNNPGRVVREGDEYAYNYNLLANTIEAFTQFKFTYRKWDFYLAQSFTKSQYQREGLYRNGLYPTNSFGKGNKYEFQDFGFKGGLTYKLTGQHLFTVNAAHMTKAPSLRNSFPNARMNHNVVEGLESELVSSVDASYIIRAPKFKSRLTAFYSKIDNAIETSFFYGEGIFEGDDANAFVAETVSDVSRRNIGLELGMEYQVTPTIKIIGAANYGEYIYANNPNVTINNDDLASEFNINPSTDFGKASLKNYRVAGTPQQAYTLGVEYRDPNFWWIGANANYLADNYLDVSALLRTENFFKDPESLFGTPFQDVSRENAEKLLKQERLEDIFLVNLTGGKSWRIKGNTVGFFASINNVLDLSYKTGGFEQTRNANYGELSRDVATGTNPFAPKYFYSYGRTFFVNLYVQF
ncbi:MAG: TonB-dependent receptor [Flavobacterium sp.]|nr:TonB-dependent receptor [Flavobacterium sp.]